MRLLCRIRCAHENTVIFTHPVNITAPNATFLLFKRNTYHICLGHWLDIYPKMCLNNAFLLFFKRNPNLSPVEFRAYYEKNHARMVREIAKTAKGYSRTHGPILTTRHPSQSWRIHSSSVANQHRRCPSTLSTKLCLRLRWTQSNFRKPCMTSRRMRPKPWRIRISSSSGVRRWA